MGRNLKYNKEQFKLELGHNINIQLFSMTMFRYEILFKVINLYINK